ncbi:MAG: HAD family hydrolase [Bacteroidota bacterium]
MNLQDLRIDGTWSLFLDRDGVINRRIVDDYVKTWEQFEFLPGVTDAIRKFSLLFGRIIVVSNQQGIGKGLMTENELQTIHERMVDEIKSQGGRVDAVYHSPYLHSDRSVMRKPNVGMALKARRQFPELRFNRSVMAGDSLSDMIFGKRAGMTTVFIAGDAETAKKHPRQIDFLCTDLISLANALQQL